MVVGPIGTNRSKMGGRGHKSLRPKIQEFSLFVVVQMSRGILVAPLIFEMYFLLLMGTNVSS